MVEIGKVNKNAHVALKRRGTESGQLRGHCKDSTNLYCRG